MSTERSSVNISDDKKKIATADTLNIHQGSLTENPTAVIRYQYDNHLGSASLELDENADVISYEEYHPFGTTSYRSGRTETETSQKRYKYVGKERDEETGLYYYGFRYYAAWICRFVSVDPLQFEYPQLTPYNYAGNKPITHIDIDGMQSTGDEKRNSVSKQSFTINQNEKGEITSVSISNIDVIYGENGEIVSGIANSETHENIWTLKESELYNSLNGDLKEKLNNQLSELQEDNPYLLGSPKLSLPDYSKNDGITLEENHNSLELPEIPSAISKSLGAGSALNNALEKELAKPTKLKYARRHPTKLRKIKPDVWERFYNIKANKALKVVKGIGRALGIVSTIGSIYDAIRNPTAGNILQAVTNTILLGARINPVTGIILGIADATGLSDYIFDTIGEAIMKVDFERNIRNSWSVAPIF